MKTGLSAENAYAGVSVDSPLRGACRFCATSLQHTFVNLGMSPLANSYVNDPSIPEYSYPLHVLVCDRCLLVQLQSVETPEHLFSEYAYFSSYSEGWLRHAEQYTKTMIRRFHLDHRSRVIEIASNDGYLLQYFAAQGVPVLGIEPAANVAQVAIGKGISTITRFFGEALARDLAAAGMTADHITANNVLAHVPDLKDFICGLKMVLKPQGVITLEFPHVMRLIADNQFDTIYHEHLSYFSLTTAEQIFAAYGLALFDVEELSTHGGSLRIYARHVEDESKPLCQSIGALKEKERAGGLTTLEGYTCFGARPQDTKDRLLAFLFQAKLQGKSIVGYGAPAKGNTLLNFCGIGPDLIDYTVDRNPTKQGHFLPGTHIPIHHPNRITDTKPDYVLVLPWNLIDEIQSQLSFIAQWGAQLVVPIPHVRIWA